MNKMKQLALVIIGFIVAAVVIALLLNVTKSDLQRQVSENQEKSVASAQEESRKNSEEIAFISITETDSGNNISGYLVNKNGGRYDFTLSRSELKDSTPESVYDKAQEKYDSEKTVTFISKADADNLLSMVPKIDKSKGFVKDTSAAGDTKSTTAIYAVDNDSGKSALIKIGSTGYSAETPKDGKAKTIMKFFQRKTQ